MHNCLEKIDIEEGRNVEEEVEEEVEDNLHEEKKRYTI